jgi:hypothetical protein
MEAGLINMAIDISDLPETEAWRLKWEALGLPSGLIDAMIAEANTEYNSTIAYGDYNNLADLNVIINDTSETESGAYRIVVNNSQTAKITSTQQNFSQIPCIPTTVEVYKLSDDGTTLLAYGIGLILHSRNENITVECTTDGLPPLGLHYYTNSLGTNKSTTTAVTVRALSKAAYDNIETIFFQPLTDKTYYFHAFIICTNPSSIKVKLNGVDDATAVVSAGTPDANGFSVVEAYAMHNDLPTSGYTYWNMYTESGCWFIGGGNYLLVFSGVE